MKSLSHTTLKAITRASITNDELEQVLRGIVYYSYDYALTKIAVRLFELLHQLVELLNAVHAKARYEATNVCSRRGDKEAELAKT